MKDITNLLADRGFTGKTLGDLLTIEFTNKNGAVMTLDQGLQALADGRDVNMRGKTPEELQKMQELFDNPFINTAINQAGRIQVPKQAAFDADLRVAREAQETVRKAGELELQPLTPVKEPAPKNPVYPKPEKLPKISSKKELQWLKELNQALKAAGAELNLTEPADLARLAIIKPTKNKEGDPDVKFSFAVGKKRKFKLYDGQDDEYRYDKKELLDKQPKKFTVKDVRRLIKAAKNNELYVLPLNSSKNKASLRQINLKDGKPVISEDFETSREKYDQTLMQLADLDAIPKPKQPSTNIRFRATFGDKKAQEEVRKYNEENAKYKEQMSKRSELLKGNEGLYNLAQVGAMLTGPEKALGYGNLNIALDEMHKESLVKDLPPEERVHGLDRMDKIERLAKVSQQLGEFNVKPGQKLDREDKRMVANAMVLYAEVLRGDKMKKEGKLADFKPLEDYAKVADKLFNDKKFNKIIDSMDGADFMGLANKKADIDTCMDAMKKVAIRYAHAQKNLANPQKTAGLETPGKTDPTKQTGMTL